MTDRVDVAGLHETEFDAVVVGAGWSGMYMLHRLLQVGLRVRLYEAGSGVGGTWYWNRYPGARCDVQSLDYSYSFSEELQQEWHWTERYASQPEIERYANHVADRFGLREHMRFDSRVTAARFERAKHEWKIDASGESVVATFLVLATGTYSAPIPPDIPGLDEFGGETLFTAQWPADGAELEGKRIGIIGTGSSGMQTASAVAAMGVEHLYVFQRTPNYVVAAQNRPLDPEEESAFKKQYAEHRARCRQSGSGLVFPEFAGPVASMTDEEVTKHLDRAWTVGGPAFMGSVTDLIVDEAANRRVADYLHRRVRERVKDPEIAAMLTSTDHLVGARRLLVEISYPEIFNRPNVSLVDVKTSPIQSFTKAGLRTRDDEFELDVIILATGFDSGTGALTRIDIEVDGDSLAAKWTSGPQTYLGILVSGFPNLFVVAGPGSPSIRSHMMPSIEHHVEWISDLIEFMVQDGVHTVEATASAEASWTSHVAEEADRTLLTRDQTQYVGANVPGKSRVYLAYLGGLGRYIEICERVRAAGYEGVTFTDADGARPGRDAWSGPPADSKQVGYGGRLL